MYSFICIAYGLLDQWLKTHRSKVKHQQECIPVACVPPTRSNLLGVTRSDWGGGWLPCLTRGGDDQVWPGDGGDHVTYPTMHLVPPPPPKLNRLWKPNLRSLRSRAVNMVTTLQILVLVAWNIEYCEVFIFTTFVMRTTMSLFLLWYSVPGFSEANF